MFKMNDHFIVGRYLMFVFLYLFRVSVVPFNESFLFTNHLGLVTSNLKLKMLDIFSAQGHFQSK